MSRRCVVESCKTRDGRGSQLFSFGKPGSFRREKWLGALRISLNQEIPSSWRICAVSTFEYAVSWSYGHEWSYHNLTLQNHFAPDAWENERVDGTRQLKRNAIPTQFLSSYDAENCPPPICGSNRSEHSYSSNKRAVRTPSGNISNVPVVEKVLLPPIFFRPLELENRKRYNKRALDKINS